MKYWNLMQKMFAALFTETFDIAHADDGTEGEGGGTPPAQGLSMAQVQSMIETARKEEKDKLYGDIEKLKSEKKTLQDANTGYLKVVSERDQQITTLTAEVTALKDSQGKSQTEQLTAAEAKIAELQGALSAKDAEWTGKLEMMKLEAVKSSLLATAGKEIIPALVTGNTEAEIRAAYVASRKMYFEIKGVEVDDQGNPKATATPPGTPPATPPGTPPATPPATPAPAPAPGTAGGLDVDGMLKRLDELKPMSSREDAKEYTEIRKKLGLA